MGLLNPSSQQRVWIKVNATPVVLPGEEKPSHVYMIFHEITEGGTLRELKGARETGAVKKEKGTPRDARLRRLAEERLKRGKRETGPSPAEGDARRMLHELQVHQVELELQNEELIQAREELEKQLEKYSDLYNFAPGGSLAFSTSIDSLVRLHEPPYTDPYVRWCGRAKVARPSPIPIFCARAKLSEGKCLTLYWHRGIVWRQTSVQDAIMLS